MTYTFGVKDSPKYELLRNIPFLKTLLPHLLVVLKLSDASTLSPTLASYGLYGRWFAEREKPSEFHVIIIIFEMRQKINYFSPRDHRAPHKFKPKFCVAALDPLGDTSRASFQLSALRNGLLAHKIFDTNSARPLSSLWPNEPMSESSPALRFTRVTKIFQKRQVAVSDVSFSAPRGSTIGLLGANGSGKSTSIRIALGLLTPTVGEVEVFGERMHPGARLLRQRVGFLSDEPSFPKDINAIQYLSFVGKCFGMEKTEHQARIGTLLRAVGLTEDAGRRIGTYSTGMKTRLGVAASLLNDPELLIWDEPTAGLDPISRMQTLDLLEKLRGNKTVLLSSHILGDIDRVCDRLLILNKGQLLFDGPREQLENMLEERVLEIRAGGDLAIFRRLIHERLRRRDISLDTTRIRLELTSADVVGDVVSNILTLAREADVKVDGINSTGRQLEDAYLKLITEDEFRGFDRAAMN